MYTTSCILVQGCRSDEECSENEACINGKCSSPCACGVNAICEVTFHKAICICPPGYIGNPTSRCEPPLNPCDPNPCGVNALCELDNGNPICYCPKGLTGNPFKNCSKYLRDTLAGTTTTITIFHLQFLKEILVHQIHAVRTAAAVW